jgi:hypothetical protein
LEDAVTDGDEWWGRMPILSSWIRRQAARARREMGELGFDFEPIHQAVLAHPSLERSLAPLENRLAPVEAAFAAAFAHTARLGGAPSNAAPLREMGAAFGRMTYLCDAAADLGKDRATGRPNLLVDCFRDGEVCIAFPAILQQTWERFRQAALSLSLNRHQALLWNLVVEGLWSRAQGGREASPQEEGSEGEAAEKPRQRNRRSRQGDGTGCCCHCCDACCDAICCGECCTGCGSECLGSECCCCCCN